MYRNQSIAVVVPAYNEQELIQDTLHGIPDYVDSIYVVNDGSKDDTGERVKNIAFHDHRIILINHEINKGVGAAIVTGYTRSIIDKVDITAIMAGDNQMGPDELYKLLDPIIEGEAEYTKGNRLSSREFAEGMSDWRYLGNMILTLLTRLASGNRYISDPQNGYTAISNRVLHSLNPNSIFTWYGYCNDMIVKLSTYGYHIKDVHIPARYGNEQSKISYPKYIIKISRLLFNEFIWRLNYQHLRQSSRKANKVIAIGCGVSIMAGILAFMSLHIPSDVFHSTSFLGNMALVVMVGLSISSMGYGLKRGARFDFKW